MGNPKPYKVWTADRGIKKALVAASLDSLKEKGAAKLEIPVSDVTVVVEADGTVVDDEEYFSCLEGNTILILLSAGQKWRPVWDQGGEDEPDSALHSDLDLRYIAMKLRENLGFLVTMTPEQLEVVAEAPVEKLRDLTGYDLRDVRRLQLQCHRYLDELQEANDALQLLSLFSKAQQSAGHTAASESQDSVQMTSSESQDSVDSRPSISAPTRSLRHTRSSAANAKPYDRKGRTPGDSRPLTDTRA